MAVPYVDSRERAILSAGLLAIVLLGLFPPMIETVDYGSGRYGPPTTTRPSGHRFVFSSPIVYGIFTSTYRIDYPRLLMLVTVAAIGTLGAWLLLRNSGVRVSQPGGQTTPASLARDVKAREDRMVGASLGQAVGVPVVSPRKAKYMIEVLDSQGIDGQAKYLELVAKRPTDWPAAPPLKVVMAQPSGPLRD